MAVNFKSLSHEYIFEFMEAKLSNIVRFLRYESKEAVYFCMV